MANTLLFMQSMNNNEYTEAERWPLAHHPVRGSVIIIRLIVPSNQHLITYVVISASFITLANSLVCTWPRSSWRMVFRIKASSCTLLVILCSGVSVLLGFLLVWLAPESSSRYTNLSVGGRQRPATSVSGAAIRRRRTSFADNLGTWRTARASKKCE